MEEIISKELGLAIPSDAPILARMSREYIEHGIGWRWRTPAILAMINEPETVVLCARCVTELGIVIGGFGIMQYSIGTAHLNLLAVKPSMQRKGLGRDILRWLEKTAVIADTHRIDLEVRATNTGARCFYRDQGYAEGKFLPQYYNASEAAFRMCKRLHGL